MPEAVIVSAARTPIGRANKGSLKDFRPDDLTALITRAALDKIPALDPNDDRRLLPRLRPARRRGRQQHGADRDVAARLRDPRRHHHPLLLLLGADLADGVPRHQGRRGRRVHLGGCRDRLPLPVRHLGPHPQHQEPALRRCAAAHRGVRQGRQGLARPARGRPGPRHLHRDGPDRRERRPAARPRPQGARRVRRPLAEPGGEGDRRRLLGAGDHARDPRRRHRRLEGRRSAGRRDLRRDLAARPGLPPRRRGHRRQLLRAQRRRRRGRDHVRHQGRRARPHPAGAHRLHRRQRPLPRDHGPRPGRGHQEGARQREHVDRRHRPGRDQRGVRGPGGAVVPGPRHRPRPAQHQRRRDRGRSPVRHDRRPPAEHDAELARLARQVHRPDHHVRRRRPGHGA